MQNMTVRLWEASAAELRRWASDVADYLQSAETAEEQKRLKKVRRALLDLADNEDWLAGRRHCDVSQHSVPAERERASA